jgi:hypothetical protein
MPGKEPRTWNAIIWIEILRSTGVQTGQSRLHNVKFSGNACACAQALPKLMFRLPMCVCLACRAQGWWSRPGSNRRPQACKARALPTELRPQDRAATASQVVGPGRVERPTSRLSGVRSNHLSYEPDMIGPLRQDNRIAQPHRMPLHACPLGIRRKKEGKRRRRFIRRLSSEMSRPT